jgi:serine/threonine protein kinase
VNRAAQTVDPAQTPAADSSLIGRRIGVYHVVLLLGAGGMGQVYRARDNRLGRDVAMKVLPQAFANDAERLARFELEARVLAALNHPHIATIYGIEDADGVVAIVMELIEGESLAQALKSRSLSSGGARVMSWARPPR